MSQRAHRGSALPSYPSLLPWQVRERRFKPVRLGRRGLDPAEVYAFLDRVARDFALTHAALAASRCQAAAATRALCRRSDQARGGEQ